MRQFMTGFLALQPNGVVNRCRLNFRRVSSLLAVAGVVGLSPVFAKDPVATEGKPAGKAAAVQAQAQAEPVAIPECLEKLKLSDKQQDQIKEIVREYDGSLDTVWTQFSERYMQTVKVETSLLAAIEDNLTEPQRQQVREQRQKTAQHEKASATTDKPHQKPAKHEGAAEEEIADAGVTLTAEQEAAADKVHSKYRSQLRSMHHDIQGLHSRLISLEASKLTAIEKVLTKDQLAQLRLNRQSAPVATKMEVSS